VGDLAFGKRIVSIERSDGTACFPEGVDLGQLRDIVAKFLSNNPELRHNRAVELILASILISFPDCKVRDLR
jgi:hypothetical protein